MSESLTVRKLVDERIERLISKACPVIYNFIFTSRYIDLHVHCTGVSERGVLVTKLRNIKTKITKGFS